MLCIGFKEMFMKIFFIIVFLVSTFVNAQDNHDHHDHHSHEGHLHEQMVDGRQPFARADDLHENDDHDDRDYLAH
mgnify:CR=1 FL=1